MTWRRLTRAEARAEALADFRERVEAGRLLRDLLAEDDIRRAAALDETRPLLRDMTSAQLLDTLHACHRRDEHMLPCDQLDLLQAILDELDRRRGATAHERLRLRLRELDRRG